MHHYLVYNPESKRIYKCIIDDFQVYSPATDPDTYKAAQYYAANHTYTPEPRTLKEANNSPHLEEWAKGYHEELAKFEKYKAI